MKTVTFYDTETPGLPDWKVPSDSPHQPHLVSLTALQCDAETRRIIQTLDVIVKTNGWDIPKEATDVHGITKEYADAVGVDEITAVKMMLELCRGDNVRVSHNRTFDQRIIRIALKRYTAFSKDELDAWADKDSHYCTMHKSKWIMKLKPYRFNKFLKCQEPKYPSLQEAFEFFTGEKFDQARAHSSTYDTECCMRVYWKLIEMEGDKPPYVGKTDTRSSADFDRNILDPNPKKDFANSAF